MTVEDLPSSIFHEIEFEDGDRRPLRFFLSLNKDIQGNWSCGYVHYAEDGEIAIPDLVTNSSTSIEEAAKRMAAKVERYRKRQCKQTN